MVSLPRTPLREIPEDVAIPLRSPGALCYPGGGQARQWWGLGAPHQVTTASGTATLKARLVGLLLLSHGPEAPGPVETEALGRSLREDNMGSRISKV